MLFTRRVAINEATQHTIEQSRNRAAVRDAATGRRCRLAAKRRLHRRLDVVRLLDWLVACRRIVGLRCGHRCLSCYAPNAPRAALPASPAIASPPLLPPPPPPLPIAAPPNVAASPP